MATVVYGSPFANDEGKPLGVKVENYSVNEPFVIKPTYQTQTNYSIKWTNFPVEGKYVFKSPPGEDFLPEEILHYEMYKASASFNVSLEQIKNTINTIYGQDFHVTYASDGKVSGIWGGNSHASHIHTSFSPQTSSEPVEDDDDWTPGENCLF